MVGSCQGALPLPIQQTSGGEDLSCLASWQRLNSTNDRRGPRQTTIFGGSGGRRGPPAEVRSDERTAPSRAESRRNEAFGSNGCCGVPTAITDPPSSLSLPPSLPRRHGLVWHERLQRERAWRWPMISGERATSWGRGLLWPPREIGRGTQAPTPQRDEQEKQQQAILP